MLLSTRIRALLGTAAVTGAALITGVILTAPAEPAQATPPGCGTLPCTSTSNTRTATATTTVTRTTTATTTRTSTQRPGNPNPTCTSDGYGGCTSSKTKTAKPTPRPSRSSYTPPPAQLPKTGPLNGTLVAGGGAALTLGVALVLFSLRRNSKHRRPLLHRG